MEAELSPCMGAAGRRLARAVLGHCHAGDFSTGTELAAMIA